MGESFQEGFECHNIKESWAAVKNWYKFAPKENQRPSEQKMEMTVREIDQKHAKIDRKHEEVRLEEM